MKNIYLDYQQSCPYFVNHSIGWLADLPPQDSPRKAIILHQMPVYNNPQGYPQAKTGSNSGKKPPLFMLNTWYNKSYKDKAAYPPELEFLSYPQVEFAC